MLAVVVHVFVGIRVVIVAGGDDLPRLASFLAFCHWLLLCLEKSGMAFVLSGRHPQTTSPRG
jgi:hypothetical protein